MAITMYRESRSFIAKSLINRYKPSMLWHNSFLLEVVDLLLSWGAINVTQKTPNWQHSRHLRFAFHFDNQTRKMKLGNWWQSSGEISVLVAKSQLICSQDCFYACCKSASERKSADAGDFVIDCPKQLGLHAYTVSMFWAEKKYFNASWYRKWEWLEQGCKNFFGMKQRMEIFRGTHIYKLCRPLFIGISDCKSRSRT